MGANRRGNLPTPKRTNTEASDLINDVLPSMSTFNVEKGKAYGNILLLKNCLNASTNSSSEEKGSRWRTKPSSWPRSRMDWILGNRHGNCGSSRKRPRVRPKSPWKPRRSEGVPSSELQRPTRPATASGLSSRGPPPAGVTQLGSGPRRMKRQLLDAYSPPGMHLRRQCPRQRTSSPSIRDYLLGHSAPASVAPAHSIHSSEQHRHDTTVAATAFFSDPQCDCAQTQRNKN